MIEDILGTLGVYIAIAVVLVVGILGPGLLIITGHKDLLVWGFAAFVAIWILVKVAPGFRRP